MALTTEEHPKRETVSDLYCKIFTELWTVQKREETKDAVERSSKGRFDPQGLLEIPAQEREAIQHLTLIVHYYSDVEDALRTVTDASFVVQFEDLFHLMPKPPKKESQVNQITEEKKVDDKVDEKEDGKVDEKEDGKEDEEEDEKEDGKEDGKEDEKEDEKEDDVIPTGPLRALSPTQVVLKSFKPTALLTLVQALPSIAHLQLVILSKSTFSVSQAEFMRDYLRFLGPNLVSLQMWIHAMHDRNAHDEVVSNLDRVWPVLDREMPKLQHLTLEVQQNLGGPKVRTLTPKLDNIMTRLREFRFGSIDESTNLDRLLDYLGQDETIRFVKGEYSQFFNDVFFTIIKEDYWPRLVQMGTCIGSDYPSNGIKAVDFCRRMCPMQLHFDLTKVKGGYENYILMSIPLYYSIKALRLRYSHEQHLRLWKGKEVRRTPRTRRTRGRRMLHNVHNRQLHILSLQLDVTNVDCNTFGQVKGKGKFLVLLYLKMFKQLRALVIFFDDCISDYGDYEFCARDKDDESEEDDSYVPPEKEQKRKTLRKVAKVYTHKEYFEKYAHYLVEARVLENKLLQAVRIKFGAKRTLEFTREQLEDERAKQESAKERNPTKQ